MNESAKATSVNGIPIKDDYCGAMLKYEDEDELRVYCYHPKSEHDTVFESTDEVIQGPDGKFYTVVHERPHEGECKVGGCECSRFIRDGVILETGEYIPSKYIFKCEICGEYFTPFSLSRFTRDNIKRNGYIYDDVVRQYIESPDKEFELVFCEKCRSRGTKEQIELRYRADELFDELIDLVKEFKLVIRHWGNPRLLEGNDILESLIYIEEFDSWDPDAWIRLEVHSALDFLKKWIVEGDLEL